jgi:hypothetical protein
MSICMYKLFCNKSRDRPRGQSTVFRRREVPRPSRWLTLMQSRANGRVLCGMPSDRCGWRETGVRIKQEAVAPRQLSSNNCRLAVSLCVRTCLDPSKLVCGIVIRYCQLRSEDAKHEPVYNEVCCSTSGGLLSFPFLRPSARKPLRSRSSSLGAPPQSRVAPLSADIGTGCSRGAATAGAKSGSGSDSLDEYSADGRSAFTEVEAVGRDVGRDVGMDVGLEASGRGVMPDCGEPPSGEAPADVNPAEVREWKESALRPEGEAVRAARIRASRRAFSRRARCTSSCIRGSGESNS